MTRHLLLKSCTLHHFRLHFGDVSLPFLQTSASEEHQRLSINVPTEVGYLLPDTERKSRPSCALDGIFLRTHFDTSSVVAGHHGETLTTGLAGHVNRSMFVVSICRRRVNARGHRHRCRRFPDWSAMEDKGCLNFNRCTSGVCGRKVKQSLPEFE